MAQNFIQDLATIYRLHKQKRNLNLNPRRGKEELKLRHFAELCIIVINSCVIKLYYSPLEADRIMSGKFLLVAICVTQPLWPTRVPRSCKLSFILKNKLNAYYTVLLTVLSGLINSNFKYHFTLHVSLVIYLAGTALYTMPNAIEFICIS